MSENGLNLRFIFTGGGSGGHVSPALAVIAELKKRVPGADILYVGIKNKAEGIMVPKAGIPLKFVNSSPLPDKNFFKIIKFFITIFSGFLKALFILTKFKPHVIFATGGYVSAPVIFAAWILRKITLGYFRPKILIHEANVHLGKMNKLAAKAADAVAVSFSETIKDIPSGKGFFSGYPVRNIIAEGDKKKAREKLGIPESAFIVFAFGGSQGARAINRALAKAAPELLKDPDIHIVHGTGKPFGKDHRYHGFEDTISLLEKNSPELLKEKRYLIKDFIDDMELYYAASDLLIIRAGAGSIIEVCTLGKPSIIIPISSVYSDHQTGNARYVERAGAAVVLYEKTDPVKGVNIPFIETSELVESILSLKEAPQKLEQMSKKATEIFPGKPVDIIADYILYLCGISKRPDVTEGVSYLKDRILGLSSVELEHFLKKVNAGEKPLLNEDEKRLLKNKIDTYFTSSNVILRSRALRIAGLAYYCELFPLVIKCAASHEEKPFVRRDAFEALSKLITCDKNYRNQVIEAILHGLSDLYYEARFHAAKLINVFGAHYELTEEEREKLLEKLYRNIEDRCFEVRVESILAIASIENDEERSVKNFEKCYYDKIWKVRKALFKAYETLVKRKVIDSKKALEETDKILITSNGYITDYELKKQLNSSRSHISNMEVK